MKTTMFSSHLPDRRPSPARRRLSIVLGLGAVALVNAACGTTATLGGGAAMEREPLSFEVLSLEGTDLEAALEKGVATEAPFPSRVEALDGKPVVLDGYMIPLGWDDNRVTEFLLMRDNLQCCMGETPTWGHWIHARADGASIAPHLYNKPVRVEGLFKLVHPRDREEAEYASGVYELHGWRVQSTD